MDDYIKRLIQIQEEKKLSIIQLAEALDMSEAMLSMIFLDEMVPTEKQLDAIAEYVIDQLKE